MAWDFTTEPEFAAKLEWMDAFVRDEVEPLDLVWGDKTFHPLDDTLRKVVDPLKQQVREQGLWACHLGPELGGIGLRAGEALADERDPRAVRDGARSSSGARRPTPATRRSSPTTGPKSRSSVTSARCSKESSSRLTR